METIMFIVAVATAIALGSVGSVVLAMKLMGTKKGKTVVSDYAQQVTDLTYDIIKKNLRDTKKWQDLVYGGGSEE